MSDLVQTCSQFVGKCRRSSARGSLYKKRRKSVSSEIYTPQKKPKSANVLAVAPQKQGQGKPVLRRGRLGASQLPVKVSSRDQKPVDAPQSAINGGLVTIHRPEYDADMIPVNEHNVWPVLEKLLAATQSMSMLLGSLKDDLQRSATLAARMVDSMVAIDSPWSDTGIRYKRREAALKLWRAFDAYQKSFVDIESYTKETSKPVESSEATNSNTGSSNASVTANDQTATSDQLPVDQ